MRPGNENTEDETNLEEVNLPPVETQTLNRQGRMRRWTKEELIQLMYAYYLVTKNETDVLLYRQKLSDKWQELMPNIPRTVQNLASQVNSILRRSALSPAELENIKQRVRDEINEEDENQNEEVDNDNEQELIQQEEGRLEANEQHLQAQNEEQDNDRIQNNDEAIWLFNEKRLLYEGIPLPLRPSLPKLKNLSVETNISKVNEILNRFKTEIKSLKDTYHLLYVAAATVCELSGIKLKPKEKNVRIEHRDPPWKVRIEKNIIKTRKKIGILTNFLNTEVKSSQKVKTIAESILKEAKISRADPDRQIKAYTYNDKLKQKVAVLGARLRKYNEAYKKKTQKKLYQQDQKLFYRTLEQKRQTKGQPPPMAGMFDFWNDIWGNPQPYREDSWLDEERKRTTRVNPMSDFAIDTADVKKAISTASNWKSPGPDSIHNFWIKKFSSIHCVLASQFQELLENPADIPLELCSGLTYMIPKSDKTDDPKEYRPITCLSTVYKLLTKILCEKINNHLNHHNIIAREQNGCRHGSKGTKELLVIDNVVGKQAIHKQRHLSVAWIDFKKAYDSVPHSWLVESLKLYKVNHRVVKLLENLMKLWNTKLIIRGTEGYETSSIQVRRGIFQGDSLSPIWFCLALNPLSSMLQSSPYGYKIDPLTNTKITHLLYMDDIKLYASNADQLQSMLEMVKRFSDSICMEFGLNKCAAIHYRKGKIVAHPNIKLMDDTVIRDLSAPAYKYLGMMQTGEIQEKVMKEETEKAYYRRVTTITKSYLPGEEKICSINTWAIPVLEYTYGILKWSNTDLQKIDMNTRKILTKGRIHHPASSVTRLYLPRRKGGRGLCSVEDTCKKQKIKLKEFFTNNQSNLHRVIVAADKNYSPLNLSNPQELVVIEDTEERINALKAKPLHGRYFNDLHSEHVDREDSLSYLKRSGLSGESEGFIHAIQDQVAPTRAYLKLTRSPNINDKCRLCGKTQETIQHISSGCSYLAPTQYLERHNNVAKIIYLKIAEKCKLIQGREFYFKYNPPPLKENEDYKLYWDQQFQTQGTIQHNKPDIALFSKREKIAYLIDIAVPLDGNVQKACVEKRMKYQDLTYELKQIYQLKEVLIMPLVISSNGLVHKEFKNNLERLQIKNSIVRECVKAVILGTVRILRKVLG